MARYIQEDMTIIPLETQEHFAIYSGGEMAQWDALPLQDASVAYLFSKAAFHHINKDLALAFRAEATHCLQTGDKLVIADVNKHSNVDRFLNVLVNDQKQHGHQGYFLDENFGIQFQTNKLRVVKNRLQQYYWQFHTDKQNALCYIQNLFGLYNANPEYIEENLKRYLHFGTNNQGIYPLQWEMR
ncbi:MAG: hypothetical protein OIF50_09540 [Flavobacteriaceae bacterium]|nr:hypothetical protein [Flavobacteriaceae bacterium]